MVSKSTKGAKSPRTRNTLGTFEARPVPFSENPNKISDATREEVLAELWRIVQAHPDKVISRNFFRVHSKYAESAWNQFFGTWHEFKRQAGIVLSRHAHRMERDIAKHASVDIQRQTNEEKRKWEDSYIRPHGRRFQTIVHVCDIHDKECDPFYRRVLLDTITRVQPEKIIINGDLFDLPEFSKHTQDPRDFDPVGRIRWVHELFAHMRRVCPTAEITLVEGNHEFRLLRHMSEQTPALKVVLSDLHGMTVPRLLGLPEYEVNYIARADLTAWTEAAIKRELRKNYTIAYDAVLFGHYPDMRSMGYPGANGHHHRHLVWSSYSPTFGPSEWHQCGAGHIREAVYCNGERWGNGILLVHVDTHTKRSQFEYLDLSHDHAFVGGRLYRRNEDEAVLDQPQEP